SDLVFVLDRREQAGARSRVGERVAEMRRAGHRGCQGADSADRDLVAGTLQPDASVLRQARLPSYLPAKRLLRRWRSHGSVLQANQQVIGFTLEGHSTATPLPPGEVASAASR